MASGDRGPSLPRGSSTGTQSDPGQDPGYKFPGVVRVGGLGQAGQPASSDCEGLHSDLPQLARSILAF